jgi:beta-N-acetylhexosaminidase
MCGQIPVWQGDLESTCQQFDYWQQAKDNVLQTFFPVQTEAQAVLKDPTAYK